MSEYSIFISIVMPLHNQGPHVQSLVDQAIAILEELVDDYEIVIVDNASDDDTVATLKQLAEESDYPNLQIYSLMKSVDMELVTWVGVERALGDYICAVDPCSENISCLIQMLDLTQNGCDVVFATNLWRRNKSRAYVFSEWAFGLFYKGLTGVSIREDIPSFRLVNKNVVNFVLKHPQPAIAFRYLPALAGFNSNRLHYESEPSITGKKSFASSVSRAVRLLISSSKLPIRVATSLSMFGATASLIYSIYVVLVGFLKSEVASGWVSLSLQQSGMFFLLSSVLLILSEYVLYLTRLTAQGPEYHISEDFLSANTGRKNRLNVEQAAESTHNQAS